MYTGGACRGDVDEMEKKVRVIGCGERKLEARGRFCSSTPVTCRLPSSTALSISGKCFDRREGRDPFKTHHLRYRQLPALSKSQRTARREMSLKTLNRSMTAKSTKDGVHRQAKHGMCTMSRQEAKGMLRFGEMLILNLTFSSVIRFYQDVGNAREPGSHVLATIVTKVIFYSKTNPRACDRSGIKATLPKQELQKQNSFRQRLKPSR